MVQKAQVDQMGLEDRMDQKYLLILENQEGLVDPEDQEDLVARVVLEGQVGQEGKHLLVDLGNLADLMDPEA